MARIRTIKPEFWDDEEVGTLSRDARLLLIGTFNYADDEGLLRWTPAYLKAVLFMYDDDLKEAQIGHLMAELERKPMIFPYRGGTAQQRLGCIVNFHRHQRINRPQPGKLPPPSVQNGQVVLMYAARDRWVCHICGQAVSEDPTTWTDDKGKPSLDHVVPRYAGGDDYPSNLHLAHRACNSARGDRDLPFDVSGYVLRGIQGSLNGSSAVTTEPDAEPLLFDEFWAVFPIKRDRKAAQRAWLKAIWQAPPGIIIAGAEAYRDDPDRNPKKTKYASGWLNDERWADELERASAGVGSVEWAKRLAARSDA